MARTRTWYMTACSFETRQAENIATEIPIEQACANTGVTYKRLDEAGLEQFAKENCYNPRDQLTRDGIAYSAQKAFTEHMHNDDDIVYVTSGGFYYDVREKGTNKWIRFALTEGDLLIMPAGLHIRLCLTAANAVEVKRFYNKVKDWSFEPCA